MDRLLRRAISYGLARQNEQSQHGDDDDSVQRRRLLPQLLRRYSVIISPGITQAEEISAAPDFRNRMTDEWKRYHCLTTLMTQAAGEMAHCAWMASCASGNLPLSMPVATPADEQAQQHRP
eukprot:7822540-Pyramimonas_sp.AAC.1